jgi:hypothetical protein
MSTYDRVFAHIDKSRKDCMQRIKDHNRKNQIATRTSLLETTLMIKEAFEKKQGV